jgi:hypothetical protein
MDTLEYIDPDVLAKNATISAAYLYFIANADVADALWLCDEMESNFVRNITAQSQRVWLQLRTEEAARSRLVHWYRRRLHFELERRLADFSAVQRLCAASEQTAVEHRVAEIGEYLTAFAHDEEARFVDKVRKLAPAVLDTDAPRDQDPVLVRRAAAVVPRRLYRSCVDERLVSQRLNQLGTEAKTAYRVLMERQSGQWATRSFARQAVYWMDGQRSLLDICDLIELDTGVRDLGFIVDYADWLVRLGFIELSTE